MSNNRDESPSNNHHINKQDAVQADDLLRERQQNSLHSSLPLPLSDDSKGPEISDDAKPVTLSKNSKGLEPSNDAKQPVNADDAAEIPLPNTIMPAAASNAKGDLIPSRSAKERARSGPPSNPGIHARTRLARIEESVPTPANAPAPVPLSPTSPTQEQQGFFSNTVRRLTGTMAALNRLTGQMAKINKASYEPPPPPLVLYRPPIDIAEMNHRSPSWRRSRAVRASMRMRQRRVRDKHSGPSMQTVMLSLFLVLLVLLVALASSGSAYAYSFYQSQLPQVNNIAHKQITQVSRLYDRNGVFLGDVYDSNGAGRRTYVEINTIPKVMQDAMVAAENRTFWTDPGIDPQGIPSCSYRLCLSWFQSRTRCQYFDSATCEGYDE